MLCYVKLMKKLINNAGNTEKMICLVCQLMCPYYFSLCCCDFIVLHPLKLQPGELKTSLSMVMQIGKGDIS